MENIQARVMNRFFRKVFMSINVYFIRLTRGRLGSRLGHQEILLLHSLGRRSGRDHITPIAYYFTNGFYFLIGSNWAKDTNADWYLNLRAQPRTTIEVKGHTIGVQAT